jgi:hypothetical protein
MTPAQEQGVRRAIAFAEMLDHPALIRCMGNWECKDFIYIGEGAGPAGPRSRSRPSLPQTTTLMLTH